MIISLKQLFEIVGEVYPIDMTVDLHDIELQGAYPFENPVVVTGKIENHAGIVVLAYHVSTTLCLLCDRCLEEIQEPFEHSFDHVLVSELNEEDDKDAFVVVEDGLLDFDELLRADILLSMPYKHLCKQDCKGLCPVCGKNRNVEECSCNTKQTDPRLEVFKKLLR